MENDNQNDNQNDNKVNIVITCDMKTGNVSVSSNKLQDKILMYGILKSAELAIVQSQLSAQRKLEIPNGVILPKGKRF